VRNTSNWRWRHSIRNAWPRHLFSDKNLLNMTLPRNSEHNYCTINAKNKHLKSSTFRHWPPKLLSKLTWFDVEFSKKKYDDGVHLSLTPIPSPPLNPIPSPPFSMLLLLLLRNTKQIHRSTTLKAGERGWQYWMSSPLISIDIYFFVKFNSRKSFDNTFWRPVSEIPKKQYHLEFVQNALL